MADVKEDFEEIDKAGSSVHLNGAVGTSAIAIPSSPGNLISEFSIYNVSTNAKTAIIYISLDGGVNFRRLSWNSEWAWSIKGSVKQIYIKASAASISYEAVLNLEAY